MIEPTVAGADALIRRNQGLFIAQFSGLLHQQKSFYAEYFETFLNPRDELQDHYCDPHPKRTLRIHAYNEMHEDGKIEDSKGSWTRPYVLGKLKKIEKAKSVADPRNGKLPRMIFDIGVEGSLLGSWLTSRMKEAFAARPLLLPNGRVSFVKSPNPFSLRTAFEGLWRPTGAIEYVCFSDDACASLFYDGQHRWFNIDISSADASYTPALFELLKSLFPPHCQAAVERLIMQCMLPMKIRDCNLPKRYVLLRPNMPVLYSGSTLTTILNTLAQYLIAIAISRALAANRIHSIDDLKMVVREAGYVISVAPCVLFEEVQFLKHSPVRDLQGDWQPLLNAGVLLRASGMCLGDYPGRGDLTTRAEEFQRGLLCGAYPYANFNLLSALWSGVGRGRYTASASKVFDYKVTDDAYPPYIVDEDSFRKRYDLTPLELDFLCELCSSAGVGYSINTSGVAKILMKDYELTTSEYVDPPQFFRDSIEPPL